MGNFIIFSSLLKDLKKTLRSFPVIQSIGIVFLFIGFSFLAGGCSSSSSDDEAVRFIVQEEPENYPTWEDRIEALFDCNAALKLRMHNLSLEKEKALAHYQYWQSKIAQAKASGVDSSSVLGLKAKSKTAEKALKKTQLKIDEALHFDADWRLNSWMWLFVGFEFVMLFFILRPVLWYEKYADDVDFIIPACFTILLICLGPLAFSLFGSPAIIAGSDLIAVLVWFIDAGLLWCLFKKSKNSDSKKLPEA